METVKTYTVHGGKLSYLKHDSATTGTPMTLSVFVPAGEGPFPVLYWLSGLTCTEDNFTTKAGAYQAAAEHGVTLEINAQPDRLDLDPFHARQALEYGCLLSIDSDAHHPRGLDTIRFGVMQAQRAWAEPDDVLNTRSLEELLDYIGQRGAEEETE